jgi:cellulose synthase operon protein C
MKRVNFSAVLLLVALSASAAEPPATVGSITRSNGLDTDKYVFVKTPSILRIAKSKPLAPAVREALSDYDQAAQLSPDPLVRAESLRRAADLRVQLVEGGELNPAELKQAIANYRRIGADYPDYADGDRVLYQLARAQQLDGDSETAINTLRTLGRQYPQSARLGDAVFRAAELLYARGRYDEAEAQYKLVLDQGRDTPYFDPAQYKYGWSLYKQAKYREALPAFLAILDRDLPQQLPDDPAAALAGVARNKSEMAGDALHVTGLSFAALGGGKAVNDYFAGAGEPRFALLVYSSLGQLMLDKHRYTDAANAYAAFIERHPGHPLAPQLQTQVAAAYRQGGFAELVAREEGRYVSDYAPSAAYWGKNQPSAAVMTQLRSDLGELAPYYHAKAQQDPPSDAAAKQADFVAAAGWYRKILEIYPQDPQLPQINLLYADSLYDGGQTREAALQYEKTAYGYPNNPKAAEAAYASIQAWQRLGKEVPAEQRPDVLRQSVAASTKYADTFPNNPQTAPVLTRAAEDLYEIKDLDGAVAMSNRVLALGSNGSAPADPELRRQALGVVADAKFAQGKYGESETAYTQLLPLTPASDAATHKTVVEQLAASIYKQGDAARSAGDMRAAAQDFQRVGQVTPDASIRANADYDAASAWFAAQDWKSAEASLEAFRSRNPSSPLLGDADKKLALAYQKNGQPGAAAAIYARLAQASADNADSRRDAAWLAATLYEQAQQTQQAADAYQSYLKAWPQPLDRGIEARQHLAALNRDEAGHRRWLQEIVQADAAAGAARTEHSKLAAAQAQLELGRVDAAAARGLALNAPLARSLAARKQATENAIGALDRAAGYGYAEVTTAATYEIGAAYRDFGRALLDSERPGNLKGDALEQYNLLLEEQADPFEQKAIEAHRANLQRVGQGVWNDWVQRSALQLAELAPAIYGKREQQDNSYDSLH